MQAFTHALKRPDLHTCRRLLESGRINVTDRDRYGRGLLHLAAFRNKPTVVTLLLSLGSDPTQEDFDGKTALLTACEAGHVEVVRVLITAGKVDASAKDHMGNTAAMHCAYKGHVRTLNLLDKANVPLLLEKQEYTGKTCLHLAVLQRALGAIRWLVKRGSAMDVRDFAGNTALHYAAEQGHRKAVDALLVGKAEVNKVDFEGKPALSIACRKGYGYVAAALLKSGASVSLKDHFGWTPLMHAVQSKQADLVKMLVEHGAVVDDRDNEGNTALMQAAECQLHGVFEQLMKCGANLTLQNHTGDCPLHAAVMCQDEALIASCLQVWTAGNREAHALLNIRNYEGKTPVVLAAMNGFLDVVRLLVCSGVDLNITDYSGSTALMWAVWNDHYATVECLLDAGAAVDLSDFFGKTALILAAGGESFEMVELLLRYSADWSIKDHLGFNAWSRACERNSKEIMALLDSLVPEESKDRTTSQSFSFDPNEVIDSEEEDEVFGKFDLDKDALHSLAHGEETERTISSIKESLRSRFARRGVKAYPLQAPGLSKLGRLMRSRRQLLKVHIFDCFTNKDVLTSIERLCHWLKQFPVAITKDLAPFAQTGSSCGIVAAFAQHDLYTTYQESPRRWSETFERQLKERLCDKVILKQAEDILDRNEEIEPIAVHSDILLTDVQVRAIVEGLCELNGGVVPEELQIPMSIDYVAFNIARVLFKDCKLEAAKRKPKFWIVNTETLEDPGNACYMFDQLFHELIMYVVQTGFIGLQLEHNYVTYDYAAD